MAVDADYVARFQRQLDLLMALQKEVTEAIKRASTRLEELQSEAKK
ncbi:hypothetical protein [Taklimakanibacter deserti]